MYGLLTLELAVPHDELFDHVVAGATGPPHVVLSQTPRQRRHQVVARQALADVLGGPYDLTRYDPPQRLDFRLANRTGINGMLLFAPRERRSTSLTLYVWATTSRWHPLGQRHRRRRIRRLLQRAQRLPAVVAHPSWPGAWAD